MAPSWDWFLDLYDSELEKLLEELAETRREASTPGINRDWWVPGLPLPAPRGVPVAGVDGGGGVQGLAGGGAVYVARAYGYLSTGDEPERLLELRYYPVREGEILEAMRTWVELRTAHRLAARIEEGSALLLDGSLWAITTKALSSLLRVARGALTATGSVYALLFHSYSIASIVELVELAAKKRVTIAFVSKDHSYRFLKEKAVLETLAAKNRSLKRLVEELLEWYPSPTAKKKALGLRRKLGLEERTLLDMGLENGYRDPLFIEDYAGPEPGYTRPLRIPCPERIGRILGYTSPKELVEKTLETAEPLLPGKDYEELAAALSRAARALHQLPSPVAYYARLSRGDTLLLVEKPDPRTPYHMPGRPYYREETATDTLPLLVRDYAGPAYYNTPLVMAHINATMKTEQLESYTQLLEALAASRGIKLRPTRRTTLYRASPRKHRKP